MDYMPAAVATPPPTQQPQCPGTTGNKYATKSYVGRPTLC